jgi:hypothetical protein
MDLYAKGWIDTTAGLENTYRKELIAFYEARNVHFRPEEKTFDYIRKAYHDLFNADLDVSHIPGEKFYFLDNGSPLCELGRHSKMIRDQALLEKIRHAFKTNDRVLVVFGGAHAIAVKPALYELMERLD